MITWAELCASHSPIESAGMKYGVDWSACPLDDFGGSFLGPANFTGAITARFPSAVHSAGGRLIRWTSLQQENTLAHKLLGGIYFVDQEFRKQLKEVVNLHAWAEGHIAVVPPTLIAATVRWQERDDGGKLKDVEHQLATLPPVRSVGILHSGPLDDQGHASECLLLWFGTELGVSPRVLRYIEHELNWDLVARSIEY